MVERGKAGAVPVEKDGVPLEKDPTAIVFKAKMPPQSSSKKDQLESDRPMSTSATSLRSAVSAKQNIERQRREQRAVGTILSGAATLVVVAVVVVTSLAGFGGYIIYKEFQRQSKSVTLLSARVDEDIAKLRDETKAVNQQMQIVQDDANLKINHLLDQTQKQDDQIKNLDATIEAQRLALHKMNDDLTQVKATIVILRSRRP